MWIHVPSPLCPSVPVSPDSSSGCDSFFQDCGSSVTARGMFRQPKHWRDAWTTGRLTPLRFGPTLPASTVEAGLEAWISSWVEYRASRSAWPASARDRQTSGGYGPTSGAGFGTYDPVSSSWRTFPDLFGMAYPLSLETWPKRGSLRSGVVSARRMWERPTAESVCSSWPTPVSNDAKKSEIDQHKSLTSSVQKWPTPTTNDSKNDNPPSQAERNTPPRSVAACMWPSPRAEDSEATGAHRGVPDTLTSATRQWQTPATDSFRSRGGERKDEMGLDQQARSFRRDQQTGRGGPRTPAPVVLNPRFVEALMGLPDGMTGSTPLEMRSFRSWLATHSQRLRELLDSTSMVRSAA